MEVKNKPVKETPTSRESDARVTGRELDVEVSDERLQVVVAQTLQVEGRFEFEIFQLHCVYVHLLMSGENKVVVVDVFCSVLEKY